MWWRQISLWCRRGSSLCPKAETAGTAANFSVSTGSPKGLCVSTDNRKSGCADCRRSHVGSGHVVEPQDLTVICDECGRGARFAGIDASLGDMVGGVREEGWALARPTAVRTINRLAPLLAVATLGGVCGKSRATLNIAAA